MLDSTKKIKSIRATDDSTIGLDTKDGIHCWYKGHLTAICIIYDIPTKLGREIEQIYRDTSILQTAAEGLQLSLFSQQRKQCNVGQRKDMGFTFMQIQCPNMLQEWCEMTDSSL